MRFKTLAISLFAVLTAASCMDDLISKVPECARKCFDEQSKNTGCAIDDYKCQCTEVQGITSGISPCISTSCNSEDQKETTKIATKICLDVHHKNGTGTFHSAMHSLASVAGSAFASMTGAMGPEFTSATGAAGDTFTSATAAIGDAYTSATAVVGDVLGSATQGTASPTSSTPAAANHVTVGMGMVGAAAVFALAL
ncbi:hypothetical protein F4680DRAFT_172189 [Xylaria scruposa]|nr:hypothetical protein F4680DRAFT_172189 [Xylaria scruposa]